MDALITQKGQNGILHIHEDHIEISRNTLGGRSSQGAKGSRRFFYSDIVSIEYKTPSFLGNGYFKIVSSGTEDIDAKVGLLSSSMDSLKDPNTVILRAFTKATSLKWDNAYEVAMKKLKAVKAISSPPSTPIINSTYDELKKLGELLNSGVLTQEEFEKEKSKLLA